ncbi:MAG: SH3 domain-containing protein [Brevinematales bacterium]|nr:SH3 domain-containing protein [Brevinematales bacterium]
MKKNIFYIIVLFTLLLFIPLFAKKAEVNCGGYYYNSGIGKIYYMYGDKVNVRQEPSTNGKKIGQLSIGAAVKILEKTDQIWEMNGHEEEWYKVEYADAGGKLKEGYVWGGMIAKASWVWIETENLIPKQTMILMGVSKSGGVPSLKFRVLQNYRLISESEEIVPPGNQYFGSMPQNFGLTAGIYTDIGFKHPADIIYIGFYMDGGECNRNQIYYMFYDGKKVYYGLQAESTAGEGGGTSLSIDLPKAGANSDIFTLVYGDYCEPYGDEEFDPKIHKTEYTKIKYQWTGKSVIQLDHKDE